MKNVRLGPGAESLRRRPTEEFGRRAALLRCEPTEEVAEVGKTPLAGNPVDRPIGRHQHDRQVQPALVRPLVGNVRRPDVIRRRRREVSSEQVFRHRQSGGFEKNALKSEKTGKNGNFVLSKVRS